MFASEKEEAGNFDSPYIFLEGSEMLCITQHYHTEIIDFAPSKSICQSYMTDIILDYKIIRMNLNVFKLPFICWWRLYKCELAPNPV